MNEHTKKDKIRNADILDKRGVKRRRKILACGESQER